MIFKPKVIKSLLSFQAKEIFIKKLEISEVELRGSEIN